MKDILELSRYFEEAASPECKKDLSEIAQNLEGSQILKIAAEVRELLKEGKPVLNLTVGDFSPREFPVPSSLVEGINEAFSQRLTNYPPADGLPDLKQAICDLYERELNFVIPPSSVVVQSGGRPGIYATYRALLDKGEKVVYPVPSWNNRYYAGLVGAQVVEVKTEAADGFLPTATHLAPHLAGARLIVINTPVNPTGTVIGEKALEEICQLVVDENTRRRDRGEKALYLLFDQIYWMLTFGAARHYTPYHVCPAVAPYVILLDGISKGFAATGLRLGWTVAPPILINAIKTILAHIGAWAATPIQRGTALLLSGKEGDGYRYEGFLAEMRESVQARLEALHEGFTRLEAEGIPIESVAPEGAIYLSVKLNLKGKSFKGETISSNEDMRRVLLREAGFAVVPFDAFGATTLDGWCRLSVGAVSLAEIEEGMTRLTHVLREIR